MSANTRTESNRDESVAGTPGMPDPRLLDGRAVQARLLDEVASEIRRAEGETGRVGRLVSISIGDIPEVGVYIRGQARAAERAGIRFDQQAWPGEMGRGLKLAACGARLVVRAFVDLLVEHAREVSNGINLRSPGRG